MSMSISREENKKEYLHSISFPISIFTATLGSLESIVKYLRENKKLRFVQIAEVTGRSPQSLSVTYRRAVKKVSEKLSDAQSKMQIPAAVLLNKKLSVLENIVVFIKKYYLLSYKEISVLLKRDERTIWTVFNRASKKVDLRVLKSAESAAKEETFAKQNTKQFISIPVSVFSSELSSSETVVKYLHENLGLRFFEIAKLMSRDQRNIGATYRFAKQKVLSKFTELKSDINIPITVFSEGKLSVLESTVAYLKGAYKSISYHQIGELLKRDERTVWTVYSRSKSKNGQK